MAEERTLSRRELWRRATERIGTRHEARWICEVATGFEGDEFVAGLDEPVGERAAGQVDAMLARHADGEPLPYVLGRWAFRHLDLAVDRRVLIPRPETELVAGVAIELAAEAPAPRVVADLGTGSGAIGLSLAVELPIDGTTVWITDVDDEVVAVARANLAGVGRAARNVRVGVGDWFEALPPGVRFDVVASNPPYVADGSPDLDRAVRDWEPARALFAGPDGLDAVRVLVGAAPDHLAPDGWLVLEIGTHQGDAVRALLAGAGYRDVEIRSDLAGHDRIAVARRPRP